MQGGVRQAILPGRQRTTAWPPMSSSAVSPAVDCGQAVVLSEQFGGNSLQRISERGRALSALTGQVTPKSWASQWDWQALTQSALPHGSSRKRPRDRAQASTICPQLWYYISTKSIRRDGTSFGRQRQPLATQCDPSPPVAHDPRPGGTRPLLETD